METERRKTGEEENVTDLQTWLHSASNLRHQMECFTNTWDLFHISICEDRQKTRGDGTSLLSVTFKEDRSDFFSASLATW